MKGDFRAQVVAGSGIYEFNMTQYHNGVILDGRHGPLHSHPHYMFNRRNWGLMGTLVIHEVAHHAGYVGSSASVAEECLDQ